jgi:outer membrane protein TolC
MKKHWLMIGFCLFAGSAQAAPPLSGQVLLPTGTARLLIGHDPGVAAAHAGLEAARQEAGILETSPYEWTARLSGQRRAVDTGSRYREWNAGIERTLRLPDKASADRSTGQAAVEEGKARYSEARRQSARELLTLWLDWLAAVQGQELASANRQTAQDILDAVEKRMRAGDASKLDRSLAQAALSEQRRVENDARTQVNAAWSRLNGRFPEIGRPATAFPVPVPIKEDTAFWRDRILAESPALKIAQALLHKAQAQSGRARAEKLPDPTVGLYTASEAGGQERITGISIGIPIPGGQRSLRSTQAAYLAQASSQELELMKRQLEADIASAVATSQGNYESWQIAETGMSAMQDSASLMQRAYALGEADLQALLLVRLQATAAAQNALAARTAALKANCQLLVDANLIWDLDQE